MQLTISMRARLQRGFTLIELLTTIAVIGVLASIIMVSLVTARAKGRDAQRITDLKNIEIALSSYRLEKGFYPSTLDPTIKWFSNCPIAGAWGKGDLPNTGDTGWIPGLAPTFMQQLPNDPTPKTDRCYMYVSDGKNYMLLAHQTVETYTEATNPYPRPLSLTGTTCLVRFSYENTFALYTPGARCW